MTNKNKSKWFRIESIVLVLTIVLLGIIRSFITVVPGYENKTNKQSALDHQTI